MTYNSTHLPIKQLLLDPNNYRVQESSDFVRASQSRFADPTVQEKAFQRLKDQSLLTLKGSILRNGFLEFEPLIVRPFADADPPTYLVIDGNRRLSALKWIQQDHDAGVTVPEVVLKALENIPVVVVEANEGEEFHYEALMGVRHVSGIKEWGGYQRAKLIATLRDERNLEATEVAERLGLSTQEVNRRFRAFKALEQMMNHEEFGDYATPEMYPLFHEALSIPSLRSWLDWSDEERAFCKEEELCQFYGLLTPATTEEGEFQAEKPAKIGTYSQVRDLKIILQHPEAKQTLLDTESSLADALSVAKRDQLSRTWVTQLERAESALKIVAIDELVSATDQEIQILIDISELCKRRLSQRELLLTNPDANNANEAGASTSS